MKIYLIRQLSLLALSATLLVSCQKEAGFTDDLDNGPNGPGGPGGPITTDIKGDWTFQGLYAKTNSSVTIEESGQEFKVVALSDYNTENNVGELTITDTKFNFKGIGHTVNDEATLELYLDGLLVEEQTDPFEYTTDPQDISYDYTRNDDDSITFASSIVNVPDPSGGGTVPTPTGPSGAKVVIVGDILTITTGYKFTTPFVDQGVPGELAVDAVSVMRFKKK